jgi:aspartyl-tRNA(Asn)/glutamyl-tRNA(Gln) amidotransferase subunit A
MMNVPQDPLGEGGLAKFSRDFRNGKITSLSATQAYLARIAALDKHLGAFEHVDAEKALACARAVDLLWASGVDLGPLMGVPVAVKDVFVIRGYPAPRAGSRLDLTPIVGTQEGPFVDALRRCGVVILGTTKAVELCLGITGVSATLGTPRNPWDLNRHRVPGGSSSGSGVACAAGLCAFAIGSDSGGSVRVPAAFNGIFGLKTTFGHWPTAGSVPLDPSVDSIGLLTRSAKDARVVFDALENQLFGRRETRPARNVRLDTLVVGHPVNHFHEGLAAEVEAAMSAADDALRSAGCRFRDLRITEAAEREHYFPQSMPVSLLAMLGKETFEKSRPLIDPVVAARIATGVSVDAADFMRRCDQRMRHIEAAKRYFTEVDVIACPTAALPAPLLADFDDPKTAMTHALGMTRNTQPSNYLGQCAISMPLKRGPGELPVGYQLIGAPSSDSSLLDIAVAVEQVFGEGAAPDLSQLS